VVNVHLTATDPAERWIAARRRDGIGHTHITDADHWWDTLEPTLKQAFLGVGVDATLARLLASSVREHFCDSRRFELYPDTHDALNMIQRHGLRSVILSNHVPELTDIVDGLGLSTLIDRVITSASVGYEKPHQEAFRHALNGVAPTAAWMIGDNPIADIEGAARAGIRGTLVRRHEAEHRDVLSAVRELVGCA
jgi:putative hydrolase of the HAD superfamily